MQCRTIQTTERTKRLDAGRNLGGTVGVNGSGAAVVAGVQCGQQVDDLGAAHLADDDPVRPHPEGLAYQLAQGDLAGTFDVRAAGHQADQVRMRRRQLGRILDADDPLVRRNRTQGRSQQGRLARTGAAGDQERQSRCKDVCEQPSGFRGDRTGCRQGREILGRRPQDP